ncbi:MAG TPA: motility protein A [Spirochaetota bacterium]|nr:motility protein A [Spirochaetota bacterium]
MDLGFVIGIPGALVMVIAAILYGGFSLMLYVDIPSILITVGCSFMALMASSKLKDVTAMGKFIGLCVSQPKSNISDIVKTLVTFSEKSRREGLLSLEDEIEALKDEFFKQGIRLVVDGTDPEVIKNILYSQLNGMETRHGAGIKLFDDWGKLAPAFGMVGTLYGLVGMLANMGDPSAIGKGMAAALITTLYGAIMANGIFIPIKNKLEIRHNDEVAEKEIIVEGILSIQTGDNPRVVEEKLLAFVAPKERAKLKQTQD